MIPTATRTVNHYHCTDSPRVLRDVLHTALTEFHQVMLVYMDGEDVCATCAAVVEIAKGGIVRVRTQTGAEIDVALWDIAEATLMDAMENIA